MAKRRKIYNNIQLGSAVVMILLLMWLTVSTPFVLASQQEIAKSSNRHRHNHRLLVAARKRAPILRQQYRGKGSKNINSFSEEFLHDPHRSDYFFFHSQAIHKTKTRETYTAFHGELLVQTISTPPDFHHVNPWPGSVIIVQVHVMQCHCCMRRCKISV